MCLKYCLIIVIYTYKKPFDCHETGSWHHITDERSTNQDWKLFKTV